jgi:hypothetical protein
MAVTLGWNPQSLIYNQVLALPGMLVVMILVTRLVRACGLPEWSMHALGVLNLVAAFCLFKAKWAGLEAMPLAGIGMVVFLVTLGAAIVGGGWLARRARLVA